MSILEIIQDPDDRLLQKSLPIEDSDKSITKLMSDMLETMYHAKGSIGIAAIQVGIAKRALIVDIPIKEASNEEGEVSVRRNPYFIINPQITAISSETIILSEGCLSVKQGDGITSIRGEVERPISISIDYTNLEGKKQNLVIDGNKSEYHLWFSRCLQHEIDHLDGILFIDKLVMPIQLNDIKDVGNMEPSENT